MRIPYLLFVAFLFLGQSASSQNLTGTWEGREGSEYVKLVMIQFGDSCFGYTYDTGMGYCKANFGGHYNDSTKKLKGKGIDFIEKTLLHSLCTYDLDYSKKGDTEYLQGLLRAKTVGAKIMAMGIPSGISLHKISNAVDTTKLMAAKIVYYREKLEKDSPVLVSTPVKLQPVEMIPVTAVPAGRTDSVATATKMSRTSRLIQTIETGADSIRIILYDSGEIDGDTVTVFDNGKVVVNKLALNSKPFEIKIAIGKDNVFHAIELMADNLGAIPPNTAYMQIFAGKEKYELRASSDFSENARLNFIYKEAEK